MDEIKLGDYVQFIHRRCCSCQPNYTVGIVVRYTRDGQYGVTHGVKTGLHGFYHSRNCFNPLLKLTHTRLVKTKYAYIFV